MNEFFQALEAYLEATDGEDGNLSEVTKGRVLTILGNDTEAPEAVDDFQKLHVLKSKGLALVIYGAAGTNGSVDSPDKKLDATVSFQALLLMHPHWGGRAFGDRKWKQLEVLTDLIRTLNGAEVGPKPNNCGWGVRVLDWNPEEFDGLNAWTISCRRKLKI